MNFDLNNVNKKIIGFFAILGFVLSFISGLISGNSFINLIINSFISALGIGVLILIANVLIANFLPELLEDGAETEDDDTIDEGRVNIVMPEEDYQVQNMGTTYAESDGGDNTIDGGNPESGFKEVDLDNLKNLSNDDFSSTAAESNDEVNTDSSDTEYASSKITGNDGEMNQHSPEELAKAVKTVLKKD